jgi:hypothetical protein
LRRLGHTVTYVGLPAPERPGYDQRVALSDVLARLPHAPDVYLWVDSGGPYFPEGIEALPLPTACYLVDVHLGAWRRQAARFFDAVFVAQKDYLPAYRQAAGHAQVHWLPLAAAPDYHRRLELPRVFDVAFVGNQSLAHRSTPRARRLHLIAQRYRTNDFFRFYPPETISEIYSQARIVVNISIAGDVNMRLFEGAACGALVLTDRIANGLDELFVPGQQVAVYSGDADLLRQLDYYLGPGEAERAAIAEAGCARAVAQHLYPHRVQQILAALTAPGFVRAAPMRRADAGQRWRARRAVYTGMYMLDAVVSGARAASPNPLRRAWAVLPALARRLLR